MPRASAAAFLAAAALVPLCGLAQDAERGRLLYEAHCNECHYERVHERPRERLLVKSLPALRTEVELRARQTKRRFAPDEIEAIVEYLNRSHYRFGS